MKKCLLDLTLPEIEDIIVSFGEPKYRAKQIYDAIFTGKQIEDITNISKELREKLTDEFVAIPVKIHSKFESKDKTIKFLYELTDGNLIEGVLMSYHHGNTLCVSSQVGCRMGCKFCASGLNGLIRNLTAGEILGQVLAVNNSLCGEKFERKITNVVIMGSGEPLDNYEQVTKFLHLVNQKNGLNISVRNISLSTCGLCDKIKQLADDGFSITLTISLHAPNDEIRTQIMPIANRFSIKEVIESSKYYFEKTGRRVVFEYVLIKGLNDTFECADQLSKLVKGFPAHINLIPLNSVKEKQLIGTDKKQVYAFQNRLEKNGTSATVRRTMGEDIEGACGQLRNKILKQG